MLKEMIVVILFYASIGVLFRMKKNIKEGKLKAIYKYDFKVPRLISVYNKHNKNFIILGHYIMGFGAALSRFHTTIIESAKNLKKLNIMLYIHTIAMSIFMIYINSLISFILIGGCYFFSYKLLQEIRKLNVDIKECSEKSCYQTLKFMRYLDLLEDIGSDKFNELSEEDEIKLMEEIDADVVRQQQNLRANKVLK